ncbi:MAG: VOC family protein [Acetobacteraceae bacterium]|nr:VOC family protein [Acetobacteraceae bacterium]
MQLDHILWGAPDLDEGVRLLGELTGVTAQTGGSHPGHGTRNKLLSIGSDAFFEVIAPDPAQEQQPGSRGATIKAMPFPALLTFAVQTHDLDGTCRGANDAGLTLRRRVPMSRTRPDGVRLEWTVAQFDHPGYGNLIPFAIDWQGSPHPSATSIGGCTLRRFAALHPQPTPLAAIYRGLDLDIPVWGSVQPGLVCVLDTPRGEVCLLSR